MYWEEGPGQRQTSIDPQTNISSRSTRFYKGQGTAPIFTVPSLDKNIPADV